MAPGKACDPVSPGSRRGLFVEAPGPEGRVVCTRAEARQANCGTRPQVRVKHPPRLPPGASCAVRACQAKRTTGERATAKNARCENTRRFTMSHHRSVRLCLAVFRSMMARCARRGFPMGCRCRWSPGNGLASHLSELLFPRREIRSPTAVQSCSAFSPLPRPPLPQAYHRAPPARHRGSP